MARKKCPHCGYVVDEGFWNKAGRAGLYTTEAVIKLGVQAGIAILTQGRGKFTQHVAGRAGEAVTGECDEFTWGDLECPKCHKKMDSSIF